MKKCFMVLAGCVFVWGIAVGGAQAVTEIHWWHAMGGALGMRVDQITDNFNRSQNKYKLIADYKGTYTETMTAGIAAFRAKKQPHIIQVFEVGTATMMGAKGAIKPVYQLMAENINHPQIIVKTDKMIFIADLISWFLTGRLFAEYSLASTSQLMNMKTGRWSDEIFDRLKLPRHIMPELVQPGTVVGNLKKEIAEEIGAEPFPVIATGSHDTADAVAARPPDH